jgi:DNA-binding MarR family transcriptional regulator
MSSSSNSRAKLVQLTERGRELHALAVRLITELEETWAGYLGERKMRQLKRLLGELGDAIPPDPANGR